MKTSLFALLLFVAMASGARAQDQVIYDDARQNGWQNYGWATLDYANASPVRTGGRSISVVDPDGYQALFLHHPAFDPSPYQSLTFWIFPTVAGTNQFNVTAQLHGVARPPVLLSFPAAQVNAWQQVTIPLSSLGVAGNPAFDGFWIQNNTDSARTFYVDDIALVAIPPPDPVPLTVQPLSVVRTIDNRLFGMNLAIWDAQLGGVATAGLLTAMDARVVRIPGGSASDDYDWHRNRSVTNGSFQWSSNAATFARVAEARGAQAYVVVNYGSGTPEQAAAWVAYYNGNAADPAVIGVDAKGRDWKSVGYWAAMRGAAPLGTDDGFNFLRITHPAPFGFRYWEIGNECYGAWEYDEHGTPGSGLGGAAHDAYTYAQNFQAFFTRMLAVDPTVRIGAVGITGQDSAGNGTHAVPNPNEGNTLHSGWTPVVLATLKTLGVTPHFLVHHSYAQGPGGESDAFLLQAGASLAGDAADLRKMITDYVGGPAGAGIELALTELNSVHSDPGKQSTSLVNGLFMADASGHLARTEFNACTWWDLRNGGDTTKNNSSALYGWRLFGDYGVVAAGNTAGTPANTPYPTFYAAKLLAKWGRGGDRVVTAASGYALLTPHAARLADGTLALLVVNKHPTADLPAQLTLSGFTPGSPTAEVFSYGKANDDAAADLTTGTTHVPAGTFTYTFPSYSMTVLQVKGQFAAWRAQKFTAPELADWTLSGDAGQPARDGIANLAKYALSLEPKTSAASGLPTAGRVVVSGKTYLTFTFTKLRALTDITYEPEVSGNLQTWQSGPAFTLRTDPGTTDTATYRDLIAIEDAPRRFIRLKVTRH